VTDADQPQGNDTDQAVLPLDDLLERIPAQVKCEHSTLPPASSLQKTPMSDQ
jgi:hypothetical protein